MATELPRIQLTTEQLVLLGQFSVRTGKPPEEVLTDALQQYVPAPSTPPVDDAPAETLYDKLARKGLIGCLSGGPPDLSPNPKYMEGFGE